MSRWQNQQEAFEFAMTHPSCMLDMEMGTGKTRVAIDVAFERDNVKKILVVCPKAVIPVWRENLEKFAPDDAWLCWDVRQGTVAQKTANLKSFLDIITDKIFVVINYDSVWRKPMGDFILKQSFDMVILDESHRAKAAGSKVSRYLALLGKRVRYKMCLSGTPMANSPLDVYGQYRFLDQYIFGTNYYQFLQDFAIMGGPERRFIVGYKNQNELNRLFRKIAYSCKMSDVAERLKLPEYLPPVKIPVNLPPRSMKIVKELNTEFISECSGGHIVVNNVLTKMLRLQQISSGFCLVQENPMAEKMVQELNTSKMEALKDVLEDINPQTSVVVFCVFRHDLSAVHAVAESVGRACMEISGGINELDNWKKQSGAVLAVQIQAGAEGIDMTNANYAIYFSLPHSLALYNQSKARLYRPGQTRSVSFIHLIAEHTIDESMYKSLIKKEDIIDAVKSGKFDFGFAR